MKYGKTLAALWEANRLIQAARAKLLSVDDPQLPGERDVCARASSTLAQIAEMVEGMRTALGGQYGCRHCHKFFDGPHSLRQHSADKHGKRPKTEVRFDDSSHRGCMVCGQLPVIPEADLCAVCTFGTAEVFDE